jgi:hypothetical protein
MIAMVPSLSTAVALVVWFEQKNRWQVTSAMVYPYVVVALNVAVTAMVRRAFDRVLGHEHSGKEVVVSVLLALIYTACATSVLLVIYVLWDFPESD